MHQLPDVRRTDLLLALRDQHQVHRHRLPGIAYRMQRGEERGFRPFLVDRAAPDHDLAESGPVDDLRFERRRAPPGYIELLHVVHYVDRTSTRLNYSHYC